MTAVRPAAAGHEYPIRRWVFEDAVGRYDIDLGDSNVQPGRVRDLAAPPDLELGYGVDRGSDRLRGAVAGLYGASPDSVVITHGAQEALYLIYDVLLRPGDQVITFKPGWQQSWVVPELRGCRVDALDLGDDLRVDVEAVRRAATPRLRLVVVNTPCNPTGRVVPPHEIDALVRLVADAGAYLLLDEEYALDLASSRAGAQDRVLSVSSLSKVYGLPGLRVGWMCGPRAVVQACAERKHVTTVSNSVLCEALAVDVLARRDGYLDDYRRLTSAGSAALARWTDGHPDALRLVPPDGTPFAWIDLTTGEPSLDFCRRVLDAGVLLMPAETLGGRGAIRLCFARPPDVLAEGLRRIDGVLRAV